MAAADAKKMILNRRYSYVNLNCGLPKKKKKKKKQKNLRIATESFSEENPPSILGGRIGACLHGTLVSASGSTFFWDLDSLQTFHVAKVPRTSRRKSFQAFASTYGFHRFYAKVVCSIP